MKKIKNYEHYYATLDGRIYSIFTNRYLKHCINLSGYPQVALLKNGKQKSYPVHKLIAETYLEKGEHKKYVNHIDGNKLNNMLCNLEYVTFNENIKHAWDNGLYENTRKVSMIKANKIVLDTQTGIYYDSVKEASNSSIFRYKYLIHMLSGHSKNKTSFIYA